MAQNWTPIIRPPKDGEPVNQAVAGRAIKSLQERTDYLYQHLEEFSAQNGRLVIQNADIDQDVSLGDWVYYDPSSKKYKKALAEGAYDSVKKQYQASNRTYVVGLCISKSGGLASILMHGWIKSLSTLGINTETMVHAPETYSDGRFYLSRSAPGKMSSSGGAPLVQLGFFSGDTAFVSPLQKDIFESHTHYSFVLPSKPAASQNNAKTGWMNISGVQYVDYFYSSASPVEQAPTNMVLSIKGNGTSIENGLGVEFRLEIYRTDQDKMGVDVFVDDPSTSNIIDIDDPTSGKKYTPGFSDMDWPEYGGWVDIPGTGVSVSFVQIGAPSNNTLLQDITNLSRNTARFKVFYPNDTTGWTNVNPSDGAHTVGAAFRYLREYDTSLNIVWPPVPVESLSLENNGFKLVSGIDFKCYPQDLLWYPAGIDVGETKNYSPWSYDYPGEDLRYSKRIEAFFSRANISTARPIVLSMQSATPSLVIRDCFTKQPEIAGNLEIDLRLDLNTLSGDDAKECLAGIDPVTQRFIKSSLVSRVTAGTGIRITSSSSPGTPDTSGSVIISSSAFQDSGEVSIVSLKNAKESLVGGVTPCVVFLDPNGAKCQAIAKIRIPNGVPPNPRLKVSSSVFGSQSATGVAVFKAVYHVLRQGTNLNSFIEANAFATQIWSINFSSYLANTVLSQSYPSEQSILFGDEYPSLSGLILSTGKVNVGGNTEVLPLQEGDTVLMVLERVSTYQADLTDNYSNAEVGLTNIVWQIV